MRVLGAAVLVCLGSLAAAAKPSNPAFLGVGMQDMNGRGAGPCLVYSVTADSAASEAGLRIYDEFISIDGTALTTCDSLITAIQAREPGQLVRFDVRRGGQVLSIKVNLLSREEVLRRRFVGQVVPTAMLLRVEDRAAGELAARGKTTVVGWFDKGCVGCEGVFARVARWSSGKSRNISVLGATAGDLQKPIEENFQLMRDTARHLDVPLFLTDAETFKKFTITDNDRIHFMVIDCRGVVQHVAPVVPDGDDTSAVLDELYAATEQAVRRMKQ
ncbi:MAG: PDZ domain-containing protein [Deltaproteobacteria bacterium]|nr:PDZ domain-containing protein [Deltaproteobacteria bacterium]MCW5805003.1 PDZ domain-containing protein [Deltaproteobacteria bacterium]